MRVTLFWLLPFVVLSTCLPCLASAQETTGRIEGRLLDADGQPLLGANVVVTSPSLQGLRGISTSPQGTFTIALLPVGLYSVTISHITHETQILEGVHVHLGHTTSLGTIQLQEHLHEVEGMVVTAAPIPIDFRSTAVGAVLEDRDYKFLPLERNYQTVAALLPHATESFLGDPVNLAGATGLENRYFLDGIDVTDPVKNVGGMRLPHNFVQEVQVRTGGYEAEYRASLGGTMNAVTYSGGNQTKAQAFGYYVNHRFSGDSRRGAFEPSTGDFARYDVGCTVSGPIQKDRLWYYLAYNPAFEREDFEVPGSGFHEDRSTTHSFAGKLTWRANKSHTLVGTVLGDPTTRRAVGEVFGATTLPTSLVNPDPYLMDFRTGGISLMAEGRHLLRDDLLFKTRLSWSRRNDKRVPATTRGLNENLFI